MNDSRFKGRTFIGKKVEEIDGDKVGEVIEGKWLKRAKKRARARRQQGKGGVNIYLDDVLAVKWSDGRVGWVDKGRLTLSDDID